jgi:hypothetical protein
MYYPLFERQRHTYRMEVRIEGGQINKAQLVELDKSVRPHITN